MAAGRSPGDEECVWALNMLLHIFDIPSLLYPAYANSITSTDLKTAPTIEDKCSSYYTTNL